QFTEQLRGLARQRCLRPDLDALVDLRLQRIGDEGWAVAQEVRTEAVEDVDVFVAVDVAQATAARTFDDDGVHHLLPQPVEACSGARVRVVGTMPLGRLFRPHGARVVPRGQA